MELIKSPETKIKSGNPKNKKIEKKRKKKGKMEIERYLLLPRSYYPFSFSTIFFISIEDGKKRGSGKTRKLFKEREEGRVVDFQIAATDEIQKSFGAGGKRAE